MTTVRREGQRDVARNRRAAFDYFLGERFEAGIALRGGEVKSLRAGIANIGEAWVSLRPDGAWLEQATLSPMPHAAYPHDARRARRLLLHAREIDRIRQEVEQGGATVVPLRLYFKDGWAKVEIAVAKGKSKGDKREATRRREAERETRAAMARGRRG